MAKELVGDPKDWETNLKMRNFVEEALIAKGAEFAGSAGVSAEYSDIDIELNGKRYNIRITPKG